MLVLKTRNVLITLDIDGMDNELALPRHVQRHPLKGSIEHVDLLLVRQGEKVVVEVQIVLVGEPAAETLVNLENPTVAVEAEATHLPERIEVSIEGAEAGTQVHASDLVLPPGSTLDADADLLVVNVSMAPTAEELEAAALVRSRRRPKSPLRFRRRNWRPRRRHPLPKRRPLSKPDHTPKGRAVVRAGVARRRARKPRPVIRGNPAQHRADSGRIPRRANWRVLQGTPARPRGRGRDTAG